MGKHKLDIATEDILQHYGIKGMKWDVRRTEEELAAARGKQEENEAAGGGNEGEDEDNGIGDMLDSLGDALENVGDKLDDIGDDIKKKGKAMLVGIFGKAGDGKWKAAKPNKKLTEQFIRDAKAQKPSSMSAKANAQLKGMSKAEQRKAKNPVRRVYKQTTSPSGSTTSTVETTRKGFLGIPVTSTQSTTSYTTSYEPRKKKKN